MWGGGEKQKGWVLGEGKAQWWIESTDEGSWGGGGERADHHQRRRNCGGTPCGAASPSSQKENWVAHSSSPTQGRSRSGGNGRADREARLRHGRRRSRGGDVGEAVMLGRGDVQRVGGRGGWD
jgi:hypothetical protein